MRKQRVIPTATYQQQYSKRELELISRINELESDLVIAKHRAKTYQDMIKNDLPF